MIKFGSEVSASLSLGVKCAGHCSGEISPQIFPPGCSRHWEPPYQYFPFCFPSTLGFTQVNLRYAFIRYAFISGDGKWSPLGEEAAKGHMHVRNCKARWHMCPLSYEHPGSEGCRGGNCCLLGVGSEGSLRTRSIPEYL